MDPNLFHIDWERLFEVLLIITVLAFLVERALSLIFESRFFINKFKETSLKEIIAFIVSAAVCIVWKFDAISIIILKGEMKLYGFILTGAIVAGGSKASIKLFKDIMNIKSNAEREREKLKAQNKYIFNKDKSNEK